MSKRKRYSLPENGLSHGGAVLWIDAVPYLVAIHHQALGREQERNRLLTLLEEARDSRGESPEAKALLDWLEANLKEKP